jgi:tol-pal system protein YbgF
MTKSALTMAAIAIFALAACAPAHHQLTGSKADLLEIQKRLDEAEKKIDQLTQRVTLIQIIVDSHQRTLQDLADVTAAGDVDVANLESVSPAPEKETASALNQTPPAVSGTEKAPPVSETTPSEPSPEPALTETVESSEEQASPEPSLVETAQQPEAQASPEPQEAETAPSPETENRLVVAEQNPSYQEAMKVFRSGDYEAAGDLFEKFARQFPKDDLADNALYWSGECRYTRKDYTGALKQFRQVIDDYPTGSKVPDALLKIGFAYLSLGDKDSAITYLKKVVAQYPFSAAGTKAEERLQELQK